MEYVMAYDYLANLANTTRLSEQCEYAWIEADKFLFWNFGLSAVSVRNAVFIILFVHYVCLFTAEELVFVTKYIFSYIAGPIPWHKDGDWIIITGATDGIGKELAKRLADQRMCLLLIARSKEKLTATRNEIMEKHRQDNIMVETIVADFGDAKNANFFKHIAASIAKKNVACLINNVGVMVNNFRRFHEYEDDHLVLRQMNVNINTMLYMTNLVIGQFKNKGKGAIINIASAAGEIYPPFSRLNAYSATKAFMKAFSNCLYEELDRLDIRVQTVCPGLVYTKMAKPFLTYGDWVLGVSVESFCNWFITHMGEFKTSYGHPWHVIQMSILKQLPDWVAANFSQFGQTLAQRAIDKNNGEMDFSG